MRRRLLVLGAVACVGSACSSTLGPSNEPPGAAVLVGAGDIGWCGSAGTDETARLLDVIGGVVFTTGDNAYPAGSDADFRDCYDPFWGRHRLRTRPSAGNHDYQSPGAAPYFAYFGDRAGPAGIGYYCYTLGSWHVVVLNSNVAMSAGSAQDTWLRADLAAHQADCTLAYWHHPLFSSGPHGNDARSIDAWRTLLAAGADVVVNGHDHLYERFAPQTPEGAADAAGLRQFTVGTGGAPLYGFGAPRPNSDVRINDRFGVLKLTLQVRGYFWEFVTAGLITADAGGAACRW